MVFKKKVLALLALSILLAFAIAGCGSSETAKTEQAKPTQLVVYSGRNEKLIKPVIEQFEKETGIKVVLRAGGASELANAVMEEKNNPQADVFIANDAGTLEVLRSQGLFQPNNSDAVKKVPADLRADDGSWVGVSARSRVIMYNTKLVKESELPKSLFDLADPKWKGQVAMAISSNESVVGNVTVIRQVKGDKAAEDFLTALKANDVKVLKGHTEVRQAVGKGEFKLGWVNHYYYELEKAAGSPVAAIYPDQGPSDMGVAVNVAGVGIIKGAKNTEAAKKFIAFLLQPSIQKIFAEVNYEYPVIPGVPAKAEKSLNDFKRADVKLEVLGKELKNSMNLLEKVGMP
ncbi:extracellular solute-binding protein [Sporolituus thermophilus]|uniref:Iron(III) transport system substrate-binding protein n=1 Tax=Sporolituus thermophilus DSM 23256 TaxID=1123285 RepID=A0A1G7MYY7_9FIRM|nr:extracellular solute-binding protein [Sporolituus thermophilus]SDF66964.1 iron(III) transport system substrate-binding protein [Sporolituus thermophilus DSM 23256]